MNELNSLLNKLEAEMQVLNYWQDIPMDPEALMSTEPFCIDTMSLPQWLQFLMIPRLRMLLDQGLPLPSGSGVLPLAQEYFKNHIGANYLLSVINDIDEVLGKTER